MTFLKFDFKNRKYFMVKNITIKDFLTAIEVYNKIYPSSEDKTLSLPQYSLDVKGHVVFESKVISEWRKKQLQANQDSDNTKVDSGETSKSITESRFSSLFEQSFQEIQDTAENKSTEHSTIRYMLLPAIVAGGMGATGAYFISKEINGREIYTITLASCGLNPVNPQSNSDNSLGCVPGTVKQTGQVLNDGVIHDASYTTDEGDKYLLTSYRRDTCLGVENPADGSIPTVTIGSDVVNSDVSELPITSIEGVLCGASEQNKRERIFNFIRKIK